MTDPQVIDSQMADVYASMFGDGYQNHKKANNGLCFDPLWEANAYTTLTTCESGLTFDDSMRSHTTNKTQGRQFSYNGEQTYWYPTNNSSSTSGRRHCHNLSVLHNPATPSGDEVPNMRGNAPTSGFPADRGCSVGRPCHVRREPVLDLASTADCRTKMCSKCLNHNAINQAAYMQSDAATSIDESPILFGQNPVSTYALEDGSATGQPRIGPAVGEARPTLPHGRSSNQSQRATLSAGGPSRMSHSHIERRYRNNIKLHLDALTIKLPAMKESCTSAAYAGDPGCIFKGPSKALVIASAVKHIEGLEGDKVKTEEFIRALQNQIEGLQNLVRVSDRAIRRYLQADAISQA
jgi:hypothetical protein